MLEQIARHARSGGKDSLTFTALASADRTSGGYIKRLRGDTMMLTFNEGQLAGLGPFTFRLDQQGRLTWLTGKGIAAERLSSEGLGESRPVADNASEAGRALNRRVEVRLAD